MFNKSSPGMVQTTVLISPRFNELRKQHHITLSEAVRVGISVILAERGIAEYDNNLNIVRRCQELKLKSAEALQKLANIENNDNSKK